LRTQLYFNAGRISDMRGINGYPTFDPIIDWSLGAEYRFNRQWAAFLEFNNILNQRYYHWHNYRSFGTNFLIGATFNL